jgi:hypothetical protein
MSTVAEPRTLVVVGSQPTSRAGGLLAGIPRGDEAVLIALGSRPTKAQRVVIEEALALAADRRFTLTVEAVADAPALRERLGTARNVRIIATRGERRRWNLGRGVLNALAAT